MSTSLVMEPGFHPERDLVPRAPDQPAWRHFDAAWYLDATPALGAELADTSRGALLRHYFESGAAAGLSPNMFFDEAWYRLRYPDIAADIAAGRLASGYAHYCASGYLTHTPHWLYDDDTYAASTADLTEPALLAAGHINRYDHYLRIGSGEGRSAHPLFDPAIAAGDDDADDAGPFERFLRHAWISRTDRPASCYFDPRWFRARYPAIDRQIAAGQYACALHAYLCQPGDDAAGPCDPLAQFSEAWYRAAYPEATAAIAAGATLSGYEYFLKFGVFALHRPTPDIDLAAFLAAHTELAEAIAAGDLRDAFAVWLRHAPAAAAPPQPAPLAPAPPEIVPLEPAPLEIAPEVPAIEVPIVARFDGIDTLPGLHPSVFLEIDETIVCPPHGLVLVGWLLAAPGALAAIHLCCGSRRTPLDLARSLRPPRPDVRDSVGARHGLASELHCGVIA